MTTRQTEPIPAQTERSTASDQRDHNAMQRPVMPDEEFEPTIVRGRE